MMPDGSVRVFRVSRMKCLEYVAHRVSRLQFETAFVLLPRVGYYLDLNVHKSILLIEQPVRLDLVPPS
jgi:hypothetical protein